MECQVLGMEFDNVKGFDEFDTFADQLGGVGNGKEMGKCLHLGKKKMKKEKSVAMKNHSEAERRRRVRINGHLATLQSHLPSTSKMDKATLLAEVINQVKNLQQQAIHVSKGLLVPTDTDDLTVEPLVFNSQQRVLAIKASVCCDIRPDLFLDIKQVITSLKLKTHHSEISTLGERVKMLFILYIGDDDINYFSNGEVSINLVNAVVQALSSVMYKAPVLPEYSLRTALSHKRFRTSFEDYSPRSVLSHKRFKVSTFECSSSCS